MTYWNISLYLERIEEEEEMNKPEKMQNFERLAEKRMNDAIKKLRLLGNLANKSNYSYNEEHILQMLRILKKEIRELEAKFSQKSINTEKYFKFNVTLND